MREGGRGRQIKLTFILQLLEKVKVATAFCVDRSTQTTSLFVAVRTLIGKLIGTCTNSDSLMQQEKEEVKSRVDDMEVSFCVCHPSTFCYSSLVLVLRLPPSHHSLLFC
jgi:hypothetical protein